MYYIRFIFNKWMYVDDLKMWSRIDKVFVIKKFIKNIDIYYCNGVYNIEYDY